MSASTLSIRAASRSTRRRPATAVDLIDTTTTNILQKNDNQENGNATSTGGDENRGREVKTSSLILERSREGGPVLVKDLGLRDGVVSPRRGGGKRVSGSKTVKPLWLTVISVFVKNFVLLVVLLGLVQMIYRLAVRLNGGDGVVGVGSGVEIVELKGRLAEMEKTWKKTAKMMQVQVEVVDRKVGSEITGLKEELSQRIKEKSDFLENELRKLDGKVGSLESVFGDLSLDEFLTKEEFERFFEKLKKKGSGEDTELSLDEVRAYARDVVVKEIEKHAADGIGKVDYALATGGGMVIKHSESFNSLGKGIWSKLNVRPNGVHEDAVKILKPSFGEPGQCFPLKGSSGFVEIRLRNPIVPEAITLEHVAKSVAYDRSSAPKDCMVSGWLQGPQPSSEDKANDVFHLSEFTYDLDKSSAQTFAVSESASRAIVNVVRFDFSTNHGNPSHTCIYRVRVHGQPVKPDSIL